eukprot:CAMPEP_0181294846 /NCGR_PEP_ID=MMETSP1101-20121128/3824_1 /TAXON_ID=46948 /ORGANISM="Rhodomonas abbreviata, Strain Caron Lab Isolate" /LENGTH=74 /DNA_ID=CAMNT_0023399543 /DNA_START=15 /DNA_END=239 /DNA_ORIENTATION=-
MLSKLFSLDPKNMNMPLGHFDSAQASLVNSIGLAGKDEWGHESEVGGMGTNVAATWLPEGSNSGQQDWSWSGEP